MTIETTVITESTKAANNLVKAVIALTKVSDDLNKLPEQHTALLQLVAESQQKLDAIEKATTIAEREAAADLKLRIKENELAVFKELLTSLGMAEISSKDLAIIKNELSKAKADNSKDIQEAIDKTTAKLKAEHSSLMSSLTSSHSVDVAEKDADIKAQARETEFLNKQIASLEQTIKDEREARVAIAKADAEKQGVTVNTSSK